MLQTRVIPTLLIKNGGLAKGEKFKNYKYVGDPINAVKIFNDKEVDEIIILDIEANKIGTEPNFALIKDIASEAFMPLGYGGGITKIKHIEMLFCLGIEKVILNTQAYLNPNLIKHASEIAGSQSIVCSIDVNKNIFGVMKPYIKSGTKSVGHSVIKLAKMYEQLGAGELLINAIYRDGTGIGYDLNLIKEVSHAVNIPVIASCGAGKLEHFKDAVNCGASGVAAGDFFIYKGKRKAVLITYPKYDSLKSLFNE